MANALVTLAATVCLIWYIAIWSICLLGLSIARSYFLPPIPDPPLAHAHVGESDAEVPGVTIVRPLAGLDCNLAANLASSFELQYPIDKLEILISIKNDDDAAYRVAKEVQRNYPDIKSSLIIGTFSSIAFCFFKADSLPLVCNTGDEEAGVNPKVNNLVRPYAQASFDLFWVIDSQVWLPPGALGRAVQTFLRPIPRPSPRLFRRKAHGTRIGLIHHVPFAVQPTHSWGSQIERAFLCTTHAKMYLALNAMSIDSCVMGKSNMYRRSDLDQVPDSFFGVDESGSRGEAGAIGSSAFTQSADDRSASVVETSARPLARFAIYLAEDNMLAQSLWNEPLNLGHAIVQGDVAQTAVGDIATLRAYASRRMRWIRVRKHMVAAATYLEPLTESIISGFMGLYAFRKLILPQLTDQVLSTTTLRVLSVLFLMTHFTLWHLVDRNVFYALSGGTPLPDDEALLFTFAWILRELLALPIWLWAILGSTVDWRGQRYRILSSGRAATADKRRRRRDAERADLME